MRATWQAAVALLLRPGPVAEPTRRPGTLMFGGPLSRPLSSADNDAPESTSPARQRQALERTVAGGEVSQEIAVMRELEQRWFRQARTPAAAPCATKGWFCAS